jgi:hypothetical protein
MAEEKQLAGYAAAYETVEAARAGTRPALQISSSLTARDPLASGNASRSTPSWWP